MLSNNKICITDIIYVNRLIGNESGTHTEFKTHTLTHCQLLYKLSGKAKITYGGKTVTEKADSVRFLPPSNIFNFQPKYTADVIEKGESINIAFTSDSPLPNEITVRSYGASPLLKNLFIKLHKCWFYKHEGYYHKCVSLLYEIIATLENFEKSYLCSKTYKTIIPAINYIDEHFTENALDCDMLASICGISHTYMSRIFKKHFGISPIKYIITKRLEYACELIKGKEKTINEIATITGFSSAYYFSRAFKSNIGVCPTEYI